MGHASDNHGVAVGLESNGLNLRYGNIMQKVFGHELAHCLNVRDYEEEEYREGGYEEEYNNYMSRTGTSLDKDIQNFQDLHLDAWQWYSLTLNNKRSVKKEPYPT